MGLQRLQRNPVAQLGVPSVKWLRYRFASHFLLKKIIIDVGGPVLPPATSSPQRQQKLYKIWKKLESFIVFHNLVVEVPYLNDQSSNRYIYLRARFTWPSCSQESPKLLQNFLKHLRIDQDSRSPVLLIQLWSCTGNSYLRWQLR